VFASLVRLLKDFDLADDAMHEAFAAAVEVWQRDGVPANPRAWLISTGKFKAINALQRQRRLTALQPEIASRLDAISAIYLVFTEGYAASQGGSLVRVDLTAEAIRLGRLLQADSYSGPLGRRTQAGVARVLRSAPRPPHRCKKHLSSKFGSEASSSRGYECLLDIDSQVSWDPCRTTEGKNNQKTFAHS
jgi:Sigma-70 region 2